MADADLGEVVVRVVVSLGVVMAVVAVAYAIARRRSVRVGMIPGRRSGKRNTRPAIEVIARLGIARNVSAVALRFGDRVVLVGVAEQAPMSVLADMSAAEWDELHGTTTTTSTDQTTTSSAPPAKDRTDVATPIPFGQDAAADGGLITSASRPSFIEALRDATSRRP